MGMPKTIERVGVIYKTFKNEKKTIFNYGRGCIARHECRICHQSKN